MCILFIAFWLSIPGNQSTSGPQAIFGIEVYGSAVLNEEESRLGRAQSKYDIFCYETEDAFTKVVGFYSKQKSLKIQKESKDTAVFTMGDDTDIQVIVKNPWQGSKGSELHTNTLIVILNKKTGEVKKLPNRYNTGSDHDNFMKPQG